MDDFMQGVSKFAFTLPPLVGESLVGFVARNADLNGVEKVSSALKPAGIYTARVGYIPMIAAPTAAELARVFCTTEMEILSRCHPLVNPPGRPKNAFVDFYGTPIRWLYLETRDRRVSPSALAAAAFHRAAWNLRPLSFCAETGERLISSCPDCGVAMAWTWTCGPASCEHCRADLKNFPQQIVEGFGDPGLRFVTGLIDPVEGRRTDALAAMPAIDSVTRGDMFEFCITLARTIGAVRSPEDGSKGEKQKRLPAPVTPADLAVAGRIVLDWKKGGLAPLVEFAASETKRRGGIWGIGREFAIVRAVARNTYLHPAIRKSFERALADEMRSRTAPVRYRAFRNDAATITAMDAEEFGITCRMTRRWRRTGLLDAMVDPDSKTSVVIMDRDAIMRIAAERAGAMDRAAVREKLGVDSVAVIRMAAVGLIERVDANVAGTLATDRYRGASVAEFVERIMGVARKQEGPVLRLTVAVNGVAGADAAALWAGVFTAALDRRLPLFILRDEGPLTARLAVGADMHIAGFAALIDPAAYAGVRFSGKEAREYLKASLNTVTLLIEEKVLRDNGSRAQKLDFADVEVFRARYALSNEVALRLRIAPTSAVGRMRAAGLEPVRTLSDGTLLWGREAVDKEFAFPN